MTDEEREQVEERIKWRLSIGLYGIGQEDVKWLLSERERLEDLLANAAKAAAGGNMVTYDRLMGLVSR